MFSLKFFFCNTTDIALPSVCSCASLIGLFWKKKLEHIRNWCCFYIIFCYIMVIAKLLRLCIFEFTVDFDWPKQKVWAMLILKHAMYLWKCQSCVTVSYNLGLNARKPVFGGLPTTQAQTSLRIRADWSVPLLFAFLKVWYLNLQQAKFQLSS